MKRLFKHIGNLRNHSRTPTLTNHESREAESRLQFNMGVKGPFTVAVINKIKINSFYLSKVYMREYDVVHQIIWQARLLTHRARLALGEEQEDVQSGSCLSSARRARLVLLTDQQDQRLRPSTGKDPVMRTHRCAVGQHVRYAEDSSPTKVRLSGHEIVALLPAGSREPQYQIRTDDQTYDQVVGESQLQEEFGGLCA